MLRGVCDTNNQPKRSTFKYEEWGKLFLCIDNVESKEDWKIIGNRCPVFDYAGKKNIMIDAYKK